MTNGKRRVQKLESGLNAKQAVMHSLTEVHGFDSAEDYYRRSSALAIIGEIRVPTLLIQAIDDPFIPFAAYEHASIAANSAVSLLTPQRGGHAGFWGRSGIDSDRFWAEHRAIEFCRQRAR